MNPSNYWIELEKVLQNYDLGELVNLVQDERGYVNTGFAIETISGGRRTRYFLRKYKQGIREEEIQFEHSVIEHLASSQACPVARLQKTRLGQTYVHHFEGLEDKQGVFYAIFDFLPGEDKYTWVGPRCQEEELSNSALVLAQFHNSIYNLQPRGRRAEPKIIDLLPVIAESLATCQDKSKNTAFDDCLLESLETLQQNLAETLAKLNEPGTASMPQIVIHSDFHPGNLKYQLGMVTGMFDFDWSKIDWRAFDVALALWYFLTSWENEADGWMRLDEAQTFLKTYQDELQAHPGVGQLSQVELYYLPYLINASNLYVLNWTVLDYYAKEVDPQEYLIYLRHSLNFMLWFERSENRAELVRVCQSLIP
jgi:homoserine kinase type II